MRKRVMLDKRGLVSKVTLGTALFCTLAMVWPERLSAVVQAIGSDNGWEAIDRIKNNASSSESLNIILYFAALAIVVGGIYLLKRKTYRVSN